MGVTADTLSSISVAALVTAMVTDKNQNSEYILIVGLGMTGLSAVRYLHKKNKNIVVVDSRDNPPGLDELKKDFADVTVYLGEFDEAVFMAAHQVVVSPGVDLKEPVIKHVIAQGVEVMGDVELFAQNVTSPVIAVTGSNGKSTVVKLLGEMAKTAGLKATVAGNIGLPVLSVVNEKSDLFILELSSFQLESLKSLNTVSATVLNISPDHMDRYTSLDAYKESKSRIYQNANTVVINRDDEAVVNMGVVKQAGNRLVGFTQNEPNKNDFGLREYAGEFFLCKGEEKLIAENELKLSGRHNSLNAMAALALGEAANISMQAMLDTLKTFSGLSHRTQWVADKNNVTWINDSKGTNVGATLAAILGTKANNKLVLIAGGISKDADFLPLKKVLSSVARAVVLIGQDAEKIATALEGGIEIYHANTMQDAVKKSAALAQSGDTVLLSPACASFDMFDSYEHRGDVFMQSVKELI